MFTEILTTCITYIFLWGFSKKSEKFFCKHEIRNKVEPFISITSENVWFMKTKPIYQKTLIFVVKK